MERFFATCPRGLEPLLAEDLTAAGGIEPTPVPGGVHFTGDWPACYAANLHSRIATRILWRVAHGAYAREDEHKKGSDDAQVTGMASSYARKYALCGAFAIDGQSDPDAMEEQPAPEEKQPPADGPFTAHCRSCGARYQFASMPQYMEFVANSPCCPRPDWQVE